jgi:hypothetical protein
MIRGVNYFFRILFYMLQYISGFTIINFFFQYRLPAIDNRLPYALPSFNLEELFDL